MARPKKSTTVQPKIKPMAGYVLVEPVEIEKTTVAGIILPDTHDEKSQKGKVVALGNARVADSGKKIEAEFSVGDMILYRKWGGDEVKLGLTGKEYLFIKFEDVLAILE